MSEQTTLIILDEDRRDSTFGSHVVCSYKLINLTPNPCMFDPKFGNINYLMTMPAKNRLKGYLRTFIYMSVCGLLFVVGGGAFFIHESISMANQKIPTKHVTSQGRSRDYVRHSTESYAKELKIVGFSFLGVGVILFFIGAPMAYQFWKRYQRAKEIERAPMLDPAYQEQLKNAYYTTPRPGLKVQKDSKETNLKQSRPSSESKNKNSPLRFWRFGRKKSISEDAFRIAAHHHPSFNLVPIESLAALSRIQRKRSSYQNIDCAPNIPEAIPESEGESSSNKSTPTTRNSTFFNRAFGTDENEPNSQLNDGTTGLLGQQGSDNINNEEENSENDSGSISDASEEPND